MQRVSLLRLSSVASDSSYRYSEASRSSSDYEYDVEAHDEATALAVALQESAQEQVFQQMQHDRTNQIDQHQEDEDEQQNWEQYQQQWENTLGEEVDHAAVRLFQLCEEGGAESCVEIQRIIEADRTLLESTLPGTLLTPLLIACR
jgi:hypothetical protein